MSEGAVRLVVFLLCTSCAIIISNDAHRRGMNGPLCGLLVFLFSIVALPVYLIVRKRLPQVPEGSLESPTSARVGNVNPGAQRIRLRH